MSDVIAVMPEAIFMAETKLNQNGLVNLMDSLGTEDWSTDTDNPAQVLTEIAGKSCYMSFSTELNRNLTKTGGRNNHDYIQKGIIATGHGSVLEHSSCTFMLRNVSRVVTHELVRHRAGTAFSQTSGRYVRTDSLEVYVPGILKLYPGVPEAFMEAFREQHDRYLKLVEMTGLDDMKDFNQKKKITSALRRILGNGQANNILITANHRTWRHIIAMRTDEAAEEEIRVVIADVARQLKDRYPAIYADMTELPTHAFTFEHPKV